MRSGRFPLVVLIILGLSCGQASEPGGRPDVVSVGLEHLGQTITLKAGDRLVIGLGEEPSPSGVYRWEVAGYPEEALDLVSTDQEAGRFEFTAAGEGRGQVQLTGHPRCGRGLTGSDDDIQCPVLGAGQGGAGAPVRLFVITVSVSAG
jgi:hypothetical protein